MIKLRIGAILAPLFLLFTGTAHATSTVYQDSLYVGNMWTGAGTYDDSVPGENPGDTNGIITQDSFDDTKMIHNFEIKSQGGWDATSTVTVYFWYSQTNSSGQDLGDTQLGSMTLSPSQIGQEIAIPSSYTNCNGLSFQATSTANGGDYYLYETWGDADSYTSTGEVLYSTPPWISTGGTSGTTTTTSSTTSTSGGITYITYYVTVTVTPPPPPDWTSIEEAIAQDIWALVPPVQQPSQATITEPTTITQPSLPTPGPLTTPSISTPSPTPEPGTETVDFIDGYTPISVPTTDSTPFSLGDPLSALPHMPGNTWPTPGNGSGTGFVPSGGPAFSTPIPSGSAPAPGTGITYNTPSVTVGSFPDYTPSSTTGTGPTPSGSGTSGGITPVPSGGGMVPGYTFGGVSNLPIYSYGGGVS